MRRDVTKNALSSRSRAVMGLFASILMALAMCLTGATEARAIDLGGTTIDTLDDGYVAEAGSGNWTSEHDTVFQTSVGAKLHDSAVRMI